ncbi:hypothetical protein SAY86_008117 [Trapa natans]|uniref:Uncharacterized protein n=1 Tax=Trapa natans TaxID=22666 RepID=A0AAN7QAL2_TRANT|nr:hypothetical protein SAY86_008117 [Trapa natans]
MDQDNSHWVCCMQSGPWMWIHFGWGDLQNAMMSKPTGYPNATASGGTFMEEERSLLGYGNTYLGCDVMR